MRNTENFSVLLHHSDDVSGLLPSMGQWYTDITDTIRVSPTLNASDGHLAICYFTSIFRRDPLSH